MSRLRARTWTPVERECMEWYLHWSTPPNEIEETRLHALVPKWTTVTEINYANTLPKRGVEVLANRGSSFMVLRNQDDKYWYDEYDRATADIVPGDSWTYISKEKT